MDDVKKIKKLPENILVTTGNLTCDSISHVLSSLYDVEVQPVNPKLVDNFQPGYEKFPLVIVEEDIAVLSRLRCKKSFLGGVLLISAKNREDLARKYPILQRGRDGHSYSQFNLKLMEIIDKIANLEPLGKRNLENLQQEVEQKVSKVRVDIDLKLAEIERLHQIGQECSSEVRDLRTYIESMRDGNSRISHMLIGEVSWLDELQAGDSRLSALSQVSQCFNLLLEGDNLSKHKITAFRQVCEYWYENCVYVD
jgi:hypothetical protein